jgi:hypothetical protein
MPARILASDQNRQFECIGEADAENLAVASAMVRLPRSIARRKMLNEWPCEVDAPPSSGPGRLRDLRTERNGREKGRRRIGSRPFSKN